MKTSNGWNTLFTVLLFLNVFLGCTNLFALIDEGGFYNFGWMMFSFTVAYLCWTEIEETR